MGRELPPEIRAELEALFREVQERAVTILRKHLAPQRGRRAVPPLESVEIDETARAAATRIRRRAGLPARGQQ